MSKNLKKLKGSFLKYSPKFLALLTFLFMLMSLPVLTHWLKESSEIYLQDLIVPLILALITSLIISAIFFRIYLNNKFAASVGAISASVLLGPGYQFSLKTLEKFGLPNDGRFILLYIFSTLVFSLFLSFLIYTRPKKWNPKTDVLAQSLFIIITVAFSIQLFSVLRMAITTKEAYKPPLLPEESAQALTEKPDIYYIVPDRYTNSEVLKEQFHFDNSDFTNFLTKNGFYVKKNAYSSYIHTGISISSTLNTNYHSDLVEKLHENADLPGSYYQDAVHYNSVAKKLKDVGYTFYQLGTQHEPSSQAPIADEYIQPSNQLTLMNNDFSTSIFVNQEISKTIYKSLFFHGIRLGNYRVLSFIGSAGPRGIISNFNTLKELADSPAGGRFIFAHFITPHHPFYFNADGSINKDYKNDNVGKPVKQKYISSVRFVNNQVKELITKIKENSKGKSIIILQADEGGWPSQLNLEKFEKTAPTRTIAEPLDVVLAKDMRKWSAKDLRLSYGILAAYYMPKVKKEDMDKYMNSVNTFRLVFNTYLGGSLPYLPTCHYAFPKGFTRKDGNHFFEYTDITKTLTGKDNPACAPDSNFNKK